MAHLDRLVQYKLFTPEEANAALPLVRAIAADLSRLCQDVVERRQRLTFLMERRSPTGRGPYEEELAQVEEELERDSSRLQEYVDELRQLGVEPKSPIEGLVDFPAMLDGRLVYLCWKLGEPEVGYWHELEAGFQGRQPLPEKAATTGSRS
jgi:hypothetical protein